MEKKNKGDQILLIASVSYVLLPVILFVFGWIKPVIALPCGLLLLFFGCRLYQNIGKTNIEKTDIEKTNIGKTDIGKNKVLPGMGTWRYWMIAGAVIVLWVLLSGIGGFCYQNSDYFVRNPIFRDLTNYSWPVYYDLSKEPELVRQYVGTDRVAFAYYFSFWLPVCALSKLFGAGEAVSSGLLFLWSVLGILLLLYLINRYLGKNSYPALAILIFFGGLDIIPWIKIKSIIPFTQHIEWWASFFQYSSNTTQLFWVFNQSIPVWIILALLLQMWDNRKSAALCSLAFAYSPWATMGMVPIAICSVFREKGNWKKAVTPDNLLLPLFMLLVYGSFYTANENGLAGCGSIFTIFKGRETQVLLYYAVFVLVEFGVYFICMGKHPWKNLGEYPYYEVVLAELLLIPLYHMSNANDFAMRASIPPLFLLMVYVILFLSKKEQAPKWKKCILALLLVIGGLTGVTEINRSVYYTTHYENYRNESVYSFGEMRTEEIAKITVIRDQFFVYDYEDRFFFRYLAK